MISFQQKMSFSAAILVDFFNKVAMLPDPSIKLEDLRRLGRMLVPIWTAGSNGQNYENRTQTRVI